MDSIHEHSHGCTCRTCTSEEGEPDQTATALSISLTIHASYPLEEWERRMKELANRLFPYIEIDGVAVGHLKSVVSRDSANLFLSKTIAHRTDLRCNSEWERQSVISLPTVTVNLISIFPVELTEESLAQIVQSVLK